MIKRALALVVVVIVLLSSTAAAQTRKRKPSSPSARASASFADKMAAELQAGRTQIAAQIKILTQFLYLLGGISKGIETAELANRHHEETSVALPTDQIERNKIRVKESVRNMRTGLEQLESSFRMNPALLSHYPKLAGVARIGQTAESQAAANNFEQAGRSLITAVNKLADALAAIR